MANDGDAEDPVWGTNVKEIAAFRRRSREAAGVVGAPSGTETRSVRVCSDEWEESDLKPREWLVPGYLMRESVSILGGAPAAGKSLIAIMWSVACALGRPVGRFKPIGPMRVCYYSVEDDELELKKRVSAALRYFGAKTGDMEGRLHRIHPESDPDLFKWGLTDDGQTFGLINSQAWDEVQQEMDAFRPDIFAFDPLVEMNSAPENDNAAQRLVISRFRTMARHRSLAALLIDHARKGAETAEAGDPDSLRGASSKVGASRNVITCSPMIKEDAGRWGISDAGRKSYVRVTGAKSNYSALGWTEWFEKVAHELANGEVSPAAQPWTPPEQRAISQETLDLLIDDIARGRSGDPWSPQLSSEDRSVRHLLARYEIEGTSAEKAALAMLFELGVRKQQCRNAKRQPRQALRAPSKLPAAKWLVEERKPDGEPFYRDETAEDIEAFYGDCSTHAPRQDGYAPQKPIHAPQEETSFDW